MRNTISLDLLNRMRDDWDTRARSNARHYVATGKLVWTDEEFFRSGESHVQDEILDDIGSVCQGRDPASMRVLEVGCGAGRVTRALAKIFGRVDGVDVSGEMLACAKEALRSVANVHLHQNNGMDLSDFRDSEFDFAFSSIVFQHIPSRAVIENYVREVSRVLRPGALFKFQIQGVLTDESTADSWVGVGFTEDEMQNMATRTSFDMRSCRGANTQYFWLWFFKRNENAI